LIFVEWATSTMISPHCALRPGTELVVVVGAGGHGKVVAEALSLMVSDEIDGFIDCNEAIQGTCVLGRPVIAGHDWLFREAEERLIAVALGIGNEFDRQRLWRECTENGIQVLTVIHPDATIASSTVIGEGAVVLAKAVLNADSQVGRGAIINTAAVIEHDVTIGDFAHVAPNATTGGGVRIGALCHIGLGAQILPGIAIGSRTSVGAGAVVLHDLPEQVVAVGNPARILPERTDTAEGNGQARQVPLPAVNRLERP
jgi:sugar O-acyltransferase (sialic acid O-acetyltransferase NeuD family)